MLETYLDLVIIGGGPIGLACALEAEEKNISYVVLEKGCLVNSLYHYPQNMQFFSTSERLEIGGIPFVSVNPKPTRQEALEYYRRVTDARKLKVHLFEEVLSVERGTGAAQGFSVTSTRGKYAARFIIVATGFYDIPYRLNVLGEDLPKVSHYYRDPHFYAFQKVMVVGAMNSAVDAALETWRKGAEVTMVIRGDSIGRRVKYWVRPDIENRITEGSIRAYYRSRVIEIREHEVEIETPEGNITIANDWVLAMTGYQPNLEFLRRLGIQLSRDEVMAPLLTEDSHESSVRNIFLAGVICGGMNTHRLFIENSRQHAGMIMGAIAGRMEAGE